RIMMVMAAAPLIAPTLGGWVLLLGGWRLIFLIQAGLGLVALALFLSCIGETLPPNSRVPLRAMPLLRGYRALVTHRQSLACMLSAGMAVAGMLAFLAGAPFVYITLYQVPEHYFGALCALNTLTLLAFTALG